MSKAQTATALLSTVALASGAVAAVPMVAVADDAAPAAVEQQAEGTGSAIVSDQANGKFLWQQAGLSSIQYIKAVFTKAASACASMPAYSLEVKGSVVYVTGPNGTFGATIEEIASNEGVVNFILACACASNMAGGNGVANAEVEGVSVEGLATAAGAL